MERPFAARTAARLQLAEVWKRRATPELSPREVLLAAPRSLAEINGIEVERPPSLSSNDGIAGLMDRASRRIEVAACFPYASQRFTFAHELGHWFLHSGHGYFRDRSLTAPGSPINRPYYEIEADTFAAELLMPRNYLKDIFLDMFRHPLQTSVPSPIIAEAVSKGKPRGWKPNDFAAADLLQRARALANCTFYRGRHFMPLVEHFGVSQTAMAIRLVELGLLL